MAAIVERRLLKLFDHILASYQTSPGRGLPIGNLTSQHFANHYLGPLDRFIKEDLRRKAYVRYMDDFVVWGPGADDLRIVHAAKIRVILHAKDGPEVVLEPRGIRRINS